MKCFTINKQFVIGARIEKVFSALTSSEEIAKYDPLKSAESDCIVGGSILNKGEATGVLFTDATVITELFKPNVFSYEYCGDNPGTERNASNYITIS